MGGGVNNLNSVPLLPVHVPRVHHHFPLVQRRMVTPYSALRSAVRCGTTRHTQCRAAQHARAVRHNAHKEGQHSMRSVVLHSTHSAM